MSCAQLNRSDPAIWQQRNNWQQWKNDNKLLTLRYLVFSFGEVWHVDTDLLLLPSHTFLHLVDLICKVFQPAPKRLISGGLFDWSLLAWFEVGRDLFIPQCTNQRHDFRNWTEIQGRLSEIVTWDLPNRSPRRKNCEPRILRKLTFHLFLPAMNVVSFLVPRQISTPKSPFPTTSLPFNLPPYILLETLQEKKSA